MDFSLQCRTCLEYRNEELCVNVTRKCNFTNSAKESIIIGVKEIIIRLVPQMAETLLDTDFICENCFNILRNCVIFIEKCLKIEEKLKTQKELKCNDTGIEALPIDISDEETANDIPPLDLKGEISQDYLIKNEATQKNSAVEDHNYSINDTNTGISTLPDNIGEHNRVITLDQSDTVIIQGLVNKLAQSGVNILEVSNPDGTVSSTKKRILLLGSHMFNLSYKCPKCATCLQNQRNYNAHVHNCGRQSTKGEDEELMKCIFCDRDIKRKRMELHLKRHEERNEKKRSKIAAAKERKRGILQCRTCFERFTSKEEYENHRELHPPYICDKCGKGFSQGTSLNAHKMSHNDPNSCICEICGKGFKTKNLLRVHQQSHKNTKVKCHICSKTFKLRLHLLRHIKLVHNTTCTIQCTQCGKLFKKGSTHDAHVRLVHLKVKPHNCKICGKSFGRTDYLQRHVARHAWDPNVSHPKKLKGRRLSVKRYNFNKEPVSLPCKFCGKCFLGIPKLKLHLETHVKVCRFPCQYCPLTFARKHICKKHELLHKGWENFFRCNICWRRLTSKEDLDAHVETKHKNPRYVCSTCGKRFHRVYLMNHHILLEHRTPEDTEKAKQIVYDSLLEVAMSKDNVQIEFKEDTQTEFNEDIETEFKEETP